MKIIVTHADRTLETLTLTEPLQIHRGQRLNRLETSTGISHFFTPDGYYDGYECPVNIPVDGEDAASVAIHEAINTLDADREFPD
jgi:hypothetical protein